jgi:hypothetical protein
MSRSLFCYRWMFNYLSRLIAKVSNKNELKEWREQIDRSKAIYLENMFFFKELRAEVARLSPTRAVSKRLRAASQSPGWIAKEFKTE